MQPTMYIKPRNRNADVANEKHLDFLIRLKIACDKQENIGNLGLQARKWALSPTVAAVVQQLGIVEEISNGKFKWIDQNLRPDKLLVKKIRDHVAILIKGSEKKKALRIADAKSKVKDLFEPKINSTYNTEIKKLVKLSSILPPSLSPEQKEELLENLMNIKF